MPLLRRTTSTRSGSRGRRCTREGAGSTPKQSSARSRSSCVEEKKGSSRKSRKSKPLLSKVQLRPTKTESDSVSSNSNSGGGGGGGGIGGGNGKHGIASKRAKRITQASILVVPSQEESLSPDFWSHRMSASRDRRKERIRKRNKRRQMVLQPPSTKSATTDAGIISKFVGCALDSPMARTAASTPEIRAQTHDASYNSQAATVGFSHVTIRKYPIILGDNPGGRTNGPPITIDFKPLTSKTFTLDEFEKLNRRKKKMKRERRKEIEQEDADSDDSVGSETYSEGDRTELMSSRRRLLILHGSGFTLQEIVEAEMKVNEIRDQREQSLFEYLSGREPWREFQETLAETATNWCTFGSKRRTERNLLMQQRPGCCTRGTPTQTPSQQQPSTSNGKFDKFIEKFANHHRHHHHHNHHHHQDAAQLVVELQRKLPETRPN